MSPEQALGQRGLVDHRTDVYSLGVTLYELLTLEPVFAGKDRQELLRQIAFEEPARPRRLNPAIPADLETVVLKALEKSPAERYATAQELANDLKRFLEGVPIQARPVGKVERLWRWCRRNPAPTAAGVLAVLAVAAMTTLTFGSALMVQLREEQALTRIALREADAQRARAEDQERFARHYLYGAQMNLAQRALESNHTGLLLDFLERHRPRQAAGPDLRGFEWYYLWRLSHDELSTLTGHTAEVASVAYSPDGRWLASGSADATVKVWDMMTRREPLSLKGHTGGVGSVQFSPDGTRLATGSADHTVRVWHMPSGQELLTLRGHTRSDSGVVFSPDGKRLASGSANNTVKVWDAQTGREVLTIKGFTGAVSSVVFSPDGKRLAVGTTLSGRGQIDPVKVWDAQTGQEIMTLKGPGERLAFSPNGKLLASGLQNYTVTLWDAATGQELRILTGDSPVWRVAFSPDGQQLAAAHQSGVVILWDPATGQQLRTIRGHTSRVRGVAFSPDGRRLASGSLDRSVKTWDPDGVPESRIFKIQTGIVNSAVFSPDGKRLASLGLTTFDEATKHWSGGEAKVWDPGTGQQLFSFKGPRYDLVFSPDGQRLASGVEEDATVKVWEAATGRELLVLRGQTGRISAVVFSPDGQRLASGSKPDVPRESATEIGFVKVWDMTTRQEVLSLPWPGGLSSLAYSPDGRRLAGAGAGRLVRVWDASTGHEDLTLRGHEGFVHRLAFSPDGRWLASCSWDGTVRIWDMGTGEEIHVLKGHVHAVASVTFSPDGKRLASGGEDKTVKLWDLLTGQELLTLRHTSTVLSVAFSPDGRHLATTVFASDKVNLWDAPLLPAPPGN
jgi:WD40 repeat protein